MTSFYNPTTITMVNITLPDDTAEYTFYPSVHGIDNCGRSNYAGFYAKVTRGSGDPSESVEIKIKYQTSFDLNVWFDIGYVNITAEDAGDTYEVPRFFSISSFGRGESFDRKDIYKCSDFYKPLVDDKNKFVDGVLGPYYRVGVATAHEVGNANLKVIAHLK